MRMTQSRYKLLKVILRGTVSSQSRKRGPERRKMSWLKTLKTWLLLRCLTEGCISKTKVAYLKKKEEKEE